MAQISVPQAAERLGVGERRVLQRIAEGSLPAARVGERWVVDERDLLPLADRQDPGRPLSERSAWAVIAVACAMAADADGHDSAPANQAASWLASLAPPERSRARKRLGDLLADAPEGPSEANIADPAINLRVLLGKRAQRVPFLISARDVPDLRDDARLVLAGLSSPESGIAGGDIVEAYAAAASLDGLADDYLLDRVDRDEDANVVLHLVPDDLAAQAPALWRAAGALPLLLAVDLAEHRRPREQARAAELVRELSAVLSHQVADQPIDEAPGGEEA